MSIPKSSRLQWTFRRVRGKLPWPACDQCRFPTVQLLFTRAVRFRFTMQTIQRYGVRELMQLICAQRCKDSHAILFNQAATTHGAKVCRHVKPHSVAQLTT
eukprot:2432577-Amphidinium_carterae.1